MKGSRIHSHTEYSEPSQEVQRSHRESSLGIHRVESREKSSLLGQPCRSEPWLLLPQLTEWERPEYKHLRIKKSRWKHLGVKTP